MIAIMWNNGQQLIRTEIKLLYLAAWPHDIGNIKSEGREDHATEPCAIPDRIEERCINLGRLKDAPKQVIEFHQSRHRLEDVPKGELEIDGDMARLPLLCPMFRLADERHMGEDRAFRQLYHIT